jgi:hypothetical protein
MASEILGLFTSPQDYRAMQDQQTQREAVQYAGLSPFQRADVSLYTGGKQLGQATGRLFGMEDPQLKKISMRQQMISGTGTMNNALPALDFTNPDMLRQASAFALQKNQDPEFAMFLAKKADEVQLNQANITAKLREKPANVDKAIQIAQTRADINQQLARLEREQIGAFSQERADAITYLKDTLAGLKVAERQGQIPDTIEIARERAKLKGLEPDSKAYNEFVDTEIGKLTSKADKVIAYGADRNAIAQGEFDKDFADLTQEQKKAVNAIADRAKEKVAESGVPKVLGQGKLGAKEITDFRSSALKPVEPYINTVNATDSALTNLKLSIEKNNPSAFRGARVQLAKAFGDATLNREDVREAGGDPSLAGKILDATSVLFTGTPSVATQRDIEATLKAMRKLAIKKGQDELQVQRRIATRAGFSQEDIADIFDIPAFRANVKAPSAARTSETIPPAVEARITQVPTPSTKPQAAPKKGQKQTRTLKSGKTVTVETE